MRAALHEEPGLTSLAQRYAGSSTPRTSRVRAPRCPSSSACSSSTLSQGARRSADRALREIEEGTGGDAYWRQPTWKRLVVIAAGPFANVLVAFVIFFGVFATGAPSNTASTAVAAVSSKTPAAAAGLQPGDKIVAVNGKHVATFDALHA